MTESLEDTAQRIAERGGDALLERLRPAFAEAAAAHADVLKLESDQLEAMVQRAADRADGLQWRRALATVAAQELGIGIGEALEHPAVARAQAIVGAPSYEESLEKLNAARTQPAAEPEPAPAPAPQPELESEPEPEPEPEPKLVPELEAEPDLEPDADALIAVSAIHLGGIGNLTPGEGEIELVFSDQGMEILRGIGGRSLGRLSWREIMALDVPISRGMIRRRREAEAQFVVRTAQGDASFEIPGMSAEEMEQAVQPLRSRLASTA